MKKPIPNGKAIDTPSGAGERHLTASIFHKGVPLEEKPGRPPEWNPNWKNFPAKCVHRLFEEQVEKTPRAPAVFFEANAVTYENLNTRANRLARLLCKKGISPDQLVGICMNRSIEMVVAIFAVLKSGGAFVPLDPEYPPERLRFMLQDAQMPVVLVHQATAKIVNFLSEATLIYVDHKQEIDGVLDQNLTHPESPDQLAYVIYTSGSTGRPKGVMISHDAICNHTFWMQDAFPLETADRVLQKTSFSFDASIWEFFSPLSFGAQLVLAKPGWHRDVGYLAREICEKNITILQMVPSVLRILLEEPQFKNCRSLKRLFCGGEALSVDLVNQIRSMLPATIINLYGPTEATIDSTYWCCPEENTVTSVPIGKSIANATIHLLDQQLKPAAANAAGEICIGGRGLARGYLNKPELTAEKFIRDPFSENFGARLYKTGDLGRWLPDGNLEYLGRIDHQVKIRGHRIELGEIESALRAHPAIQEAVVIAREDSPGDNRLVAYVLGQNAQSSLAAELRAFLQSKLPGHMIPAAWICVEKFPLTPSGKIDRNALPVPAPARPAENHTAPQTPLEKDIAAIWSQVFRFEKIGADDSFFDLGGHSLHAMQILVRVRENFAVDIPLEIVFEGATVRQMADAVLKQMLARGEDAEIETLLQELNQTSHEDVAQLPTQDTEQILPQRTF